MPKTHLATTHVATPLPVQPTAIDVLNNTSPLIALLIAIGTLMAMYRKWKASEDRRTENRALLEKRVDDMAYEQREVEQRVQQVEKQVNDHRVSIGRIETRIDDIAKGNERIEKSIDRIYDQINLIANHSAKK